MQTRDVLIRFFYPDPDPIPLIFSKCWYRAPIRYIALTFIFLHFTLHLETNNLHPSCSLIGFSILLKPSRWLFLILHMLLQHWPTIFLALAGESMTLHCDSRPSWSVCETQPTLGTSISSIAFFIFLTLSSKMTWMRCFSRCLFHTRSASPRLPVLHAALLSPPRGMVVLQMIHVATWLLSLSNLDYFHTADILSTGLPVTLHVHLSSATDVLWWKEKNGIASMFKIADPQSVEKCPYRPHPNPADMIGTSLMQTTH